ncbi:MAG: hypothetical protein AAGC65_07960 [Mucilaginibacter sp.]|uniref:hypothetical protein n=1 Tax=Mucilaginibacter sp. TaxID=1882438 RepID=UPI0031AAA482
MKRTTLIIALLFGVKVSYCQRIVFDPGHLEIVNSNAATRLAAELSYDNSLEQIHKNTDDIALNLSSVALVQTMIHRSLTEVNEALKDGIQIKQLGTLVASITKYSNQALDLAKDNPELMLFAESATQQMKERGIKIVTEVSTVVLQQKEDLLMNYNVRDELIRKVVNELQIMNALAYGIWQNMYWAKERGIIKSLNPYRQYVAKDDAIMDDILRKRRIIK